MSISARAVAAIFIAAAYAPAADAQNIMRGMRPAMSAAMVLHPSGPGPAAHARNTTRSGPPLTIAAVRAQVGQIPQHGGTNPTPSDTGSWSQALDTKTLSAEPAPGISLFTNISGTGWWNVNAYQADFSEHGAITIGAHGLTPGKVYVVGCTIRFEKPFFGKVPIAVGDQETAVSASNFNSYAVPFFAPPGDSVTIWVRPPDMPGGWTWDGCVIGTAT